MYHITKESLVETDMDKAWEFIQNPANLNLITPPDMAFEIVSELPDEMFEGMLVEYRVKIPVVGTQPWLSELKHIVPGRSFVDEQKIGPYKLWYHYHALEQIGDQVKFIDQVTYEVPYCIFGKIAHALFIRKTLERIFSYREERFQEIFS
ncbi:MAG: SRPBCC family protein [Kiritimatiellales bacterium]|nr:SRPBCC family protein [Kiritimatiellales bacterium]